MNTRKNTANNRKAAATSTAHNKSAAPQTASSRKNTNYNETHNSGNISEQHKETLLHKLFINMLKDIYWAEKHLVDALGEMQQAATSEELKEAFEDHQYQTQRHISRLEKVFGLIEETPSAKKCEAMEGLTKEAKSMIKETKDGTMTRDAALIIAAQKIEHYEIASYGSLVQVALTMGHDEAASLLEKTLWEEEDTDKLLTQVAEGYINPMADEEYSRSGNTQTEDVAVEEEEMEEA